jgi:hypothetical protein
MRRWRPDAPHHPNRAGDSGNTQNRCGGAVLSAEYTPSGRAAHANGMTLTWTGHACSTRRQPWAFRLDLASPADS